MNKNSNILFYSRNCRVCHDLLLILKNENLINKFILYCVDDNLNKLPPQIKIVPTMIVSNVPKPLEGLETFTWVKKIKFIRQHAIMSMNHKLAQKNLFQIASQKKHPRGFAEQEMSGISDTFAYTKVDNPLAKNYRSYENKTDAIFTAPEQPKINSAIQEQKLQSLENFRDGQEKYMAEVMKKKQLLVAQQHENEL